jgi:outer membrane protein OmpA-like peptidoglycan-associated protein
VEKGEGETVTHQIRKRTGENGEAVVQYNPEVKDLDISVTEKGYLPLFRTIDIPAAGDKPQVLELVPLEKEASFEIHSIHFDFESAKLRPESYPYLNSLAEYLKGNSTLRFEIIGHTDLHGSDDFNDRLSLDRAQSVKNYLVKRGLDEARFSVRGAGKRQPVSPKAGSPHDEMNRRTEFRLMGK